MTFSDLTTQELLKRIEDLMRQDQAYLEQFNATIDRLQKRQDEFRAEHPAFSPYS